MDPHDVLAPVITSSNTGADLDYGPRGPQHRDNVQLRPATPAQDGRSARRRTSGKARSGGFQGE